MSRRTKSPEYEWRITRIKSSPAAYVGRVYATDAESAIKKAIVEYDISNPEHQKPLVAQRVPSRGWLEMRVA